PAPPQAPRGACIRDYSELISTLLPCPVVRMADMAELRRRADEINLTHPRFREETALVVSLEQRRRHRLQRNALRLAQPHAGSFSVHA
ncbi:hypothetical protein, partial [Hymenobacter sp.]|uniref:hypothetical protein n=1 Tax=Hymenobacter sp. TaxID=1898978 RepID=UPI00286C6704